MQVLSGVPDGFDALVLAKLTRRKGAVLHIARDTARAAQLTAELKITAPDLPVFFFPPWDTVPYDRAAPSPDIVGARTDLLFRLKQGLLKPFLVITTPGALLQRVAPPDFFEGTSLALREDEAVEFDALLRFLTQNGYTRSDTVMESGTFAVRGGLIDIFPAGAKEPVRVDFFGDTIDSLRLFDPLTQRTRRSVREILLKPMSELAFSPEAVSRFRARFRGLFNQGQGHPVYDAVSEARYLQGVEHFLPLFHENLVPFTDYVRPAQVTTDFQIENFFDAKQTQISDHFAARQEEKTYFPVPPEMFFLQQNQVDEILSSSIAFSPFVTPETPDEGGRAGLDFAAERHQAPGDFLTPALARLTRDKRRLVFSAPTATAADRLAGLLRERGMAVSEAVGFDEALARAPAIVTAPFVKGFQGPDFILVTQQDLFGEETKSTPAKRAAARFMDDFAALSAGDLVVHRDHGIGRFEDLVTLTVAGAPHDCLQIVYDGGDKLFVPVENADWLTRYGSGEGVALDRLGGSAFEARREKVKKDLFAMADRLMATASARSLEKIEPLQAPPGLYQEFCAHFPYPETPDQLRSIQDVLEDLSCGHPMDRLVCGDVGFGKTEVALRAAFMAAAGGRQVAVIVPTTLLARQHAAQFAKRFAPFPLSTDVISRLVSPRRRREILTRLADGNLDIVIGTHALLAKGVRFKNLGLVIIDEEQHFGVAHKERLKELKKGVHVLSLSATPIPRTLQLSLSGVRDLSVIATPPVDRLAVKTFIAPFDPLIIKEALLREFYRGGQVFVVCPRISDLDKAAETLTRLVPEMKLVTAHGRMAPGELEQIMTDFTEHKFDILLATSIIESGLDISSVNTLIVLNADRFGLAALYQLRGRVGRGKLRAYAYLTTPPFKKLNPTAEKRLTVMQSLDSLGAGFMLASHDLDIRGAGNLLGQEQSGHIRQIGVALYQKMLAEAVNELKNRGAGQSETESFSPQIFVGLPVLMPPTYVADLDVRLGLYRRLGDLENEADILDFQEELIDRFGPCPPEVLNLIDTVRLKILAKKAHISRIDAGEKGATISFFKNIFPNPEGLIDYIQRQLGTIKIRPDQKVIVARPFPKPAERLSAVTKIVADIAAIAAKG